MTEHGGTVTALPSRSAHGSNGHGPVTAPSGVRNVALVGHSGAGKTTLAEALLFATGAITRQGKVEDGATVCDFEPEEIKHHMSMSLSMAPCVTGDVKLNIIDTPGYADFFGEVRAACSVADSVVIVVSAVEGIEAQTEAAWDLAAELGLPRFLFINKLDREQANFDRTRGALVERFGAGIAPLELPIADGTGVTGIADLLTDTAIFYDGWDSHPGPIPEDLAATEHEVREQLVEGIVVGDDDLMERYLEGNTPTSLELEDTLAGGVAQGVVFPVICGSAATGTGIDRLASLLAEVAPSPQSGPPIEVQAGDTVQDVSCDAAGMPLARVFKTMSDPYVGKVSLLRVLSGTIRPDSVLTNTRTHVDERLHLLELMRGKHTEPVTEARAGDIVAVPKLSDVVTGDTLAPSGTPVLIPHPPAEPAVFASALRPRSKGDEDKLMTALHRIQEEDPVLVVERVDETHQTIIRGTGETHLAVTRERLARKFGVEVETEEVLTPLRETISTAAVAEGRYKKQTGGHGQFGVASIRVEPLERGAGFRFIDKVVGGAIPRQYIPAVEKGVVEAMEHGGPHGYPVVDVQVTCLDGKHHPVDSSEMSFKMAGSLAFKEASAKAGPIVLEPISLLEVTVPANTQGAVLGDLNARRGRVQGTDALDAGTQQITALVPTAELQRYAVDLRSLTGGRGRFRAEHDHYDTVPNSLIDKIVGPRAG
jgi:elongation factor G